jgi:hypothetical protein
VLAAQGFDSDGSPVESQTWIMDTGFVPVPAFLQRSVDTQCATPDGPYNGAVLTLGTGCTNSFASLPSAFLYIGSSQYGWGELRDASAGRCLDTEYGATGNGTLLVVGACDWTPTQLWHQASLSDGSGRSYLLNNGSAKVIDTANGAGTPGTPLVIGTFTGSATQLWRWDTTG